MVVRVYANIENEKIVVSNVEAQEFVSTGGADINARTAEEHPFVNMVNSEPNANSVRAVAYASTASLLITVKVVEGKASANTA